MILGQEFCHLGYDSLFSGRVEAGQREFSATALVRLKVKRHYLADEIGGLSAPCRPHVSITDHVIKGWCFNYGDSRIVVIDYGAVSVVITLLDEMRLIRETLSIATFLLDFDVVGDSNLFDPVVIHSGHPCWEGQTRFRHDGEDRAGKFFVKVRLAGEDLVHVSSTTWKMTNSISASADFP